MAEGCYSFKCASARAGNLVPAAAAVQPDFAASGAKREPIRDGAAICAGIAVFRGPVGRGRLFACRPYRLAPPFGPRLIHCVIRIDNHAIDGLSLFDGNRAIFHVGCDAFHFTLQRIAEPAATGSEEDKNVVSSENTVGLGWQVLQIAAERIKTVGCGQPIRGYPRYPDLSTVFRCFPPIITLQPVPKPL